MNNEKPYIETIRVVTDYNYNPNYGDDRVCECGHAYYRHFDTYYHMSNVGCKYCGCGEFKEKIVVRSVSPLDPYGEEKWEDDEKIEVDVEYEIREIMKDLTESQRKLVCEVMSGKNVVKIE